MNTIKLFCWFTWRSWNFMAGQRHHYLTGFMRAWKRFYELERRDITHLEIEK